MFIDTHLHLADESDQYIDNIISEAKECGLKYMIIAGTNYEDNIRNFDIINKYDLVYGAIGFHPEEVLNVDDKIVSFIENNINNKKIVAIGEIGLDYYYDKSLRDEQIELFEKQLKLAEKYNMPVVIHSREATKDTIDILSKYKVKGVIHCFSGSLEVCKQYIKMGYLIGVGGVLTFKNSKLKDVIKEISLDNIVLETDSPFLSPIRGDKNNSKNILIVAKYISQLKNISLDEVLEKTTLNAMKLFDLK